MKGIGTNLVRELVEADGTPIVNMDADWTSKWYPVGKFEDLGFQMGWDADTVDGNLFLEYSCDPEGSLASIKNTYPTLGETEVMFLHPMLGISLYRLRFEHDSGSANITGAFHNQK